MLFQHLKPTRVAISDDLALDRIFALTGLIRELDGSCPDDLVLIYLRNTSSPELFTFFLRQALTTVIDDERGWSNEYKYRCQTRCDNPCGMDVPPSLQKAAKDYLYRRLNVALGPTAYWDTSIRWTDEQFVNPRSRNRVVVNATFPLQARKALDAAGSFVGKDLQTAAIALAGLHAAVVSFRNECDTDETLKLGCGWMYDAAKDLGLDVLSPNQTKVLDSMFSLYSNVMWDMGRSGLDKIIENQVTRNALCNLIELYTIFSAKVGFMRAVARKALYDYLRLVYVGGATPRYWTTRSQALLEKDAVSGAVDAAAALHARLSPHAALCLGHNLCVYTALVDLRNRNPNPGSFENTCWSAVWTSNYGLKEFLTRRRNFDRNVAVRIFIDREFYEMRRILNRFADENREQQNPNCSNKCYGPDEACCDSPCCG